MPGQANGQGPLTPTGHPLDSDNYESNYDYNYNYNNNLSNLSPPNNNPTTFHNASPHQLEQLELQKQHQQRIQEQIQAQESIRMQQHRVARPTAASVVQDQRPTDTKPANYYAYPPQQNTSYTIQKLTLKARLTKLFIFPCSVYGKALIGVIGIEALLVIIMQIVIVAKYFQALKTTPVYTTPNSDPIDPYLDPNNQSRSIPAYLIVFVFAQLFQLVLVWDAVRAQNTIEMIAIVIFNLCCFAYSVFEVSQIKSSLTMSVQFLKPEWTSDALANSINPYLFVVAVVLGLTQCIVTWLAYQLFQEFGWKIYKKIGADPNMKRMYRAYQIYLVLIKVDLFFFVGFSIQFVYLTLTRRSGDPEYYLTIIVLPLTMPILYSAVYAVRHESRRWMTSFIVAMLCGVAYFVFKVVRMYVGDKVDNYKGINRFLTLFATLCLVTILATIANAAVCFRNFGKGLKSQIIKEAQEPSNQTSSTRGRILEID
ncbi:hypothetical protein BGZ79_004824 [Entomortierella chlamydospora]|nr:hypothetical protein BGZ79_004824 [Entomortierella chlamydospora]